MVTACLKHASTKLSVKANIAEAIYLGESWAFIDYPGSGEFLQNTYNALMVVDVVIVVTDPDPNRAIMVEPFLKFLNEHWIRHILFINRGRLAEQRYPGSLGSLTDSIGTTPRATCPTYPG